jgi:hypothetical protein
MSVHPTSLNIHLRLKITDRPQHSGSGRFNTLLSPIDRLPDQKKINKEILEQNDTINVMELTGVYRVFHLATAQYTFFSATHGTFLKIDHTLGHKASLNRYNKIGITPCILSEQNAIKLELNNQRSIRKYANNWRLNNTLLNDQWVTEKNEPLND